jgi:hypothetical protein
MEASMDNLDQSLSALFSGPICPSCATPLRPKITTSAGGRLLPNCNTLYKVGKPHVPRAPEDTLDDEGYQPHPEDAQEYHFFDTPDPVALTQFRLDASGLPAQPSVRRRAPVTNSTRSASPTPASPTSRTLTRTSDPPPSRSLHHGYVEDEDERHAGFGPGLCSVSGIDEAYCHCGRHP